MADAEKKKGIGLWKKTSKNGKTYFAGKLPDGRWANIFKNDYHVEGDNKPDLTMFIDEPNDPGAYKGPQAQPPQTDDDSIPF